MSESLSRAVRLGAAQAARSAGSQIRAGTDLVEIAEFAHVANERFLARVFSPEEVTACEGRVESLAARFAAKEAVAKALGTGIRGIGWREIEVRTDENGAPFVRLRGRAATRADALALVDWSISLTHHAGVAIAFVIARSYEWTCLPTTAELDGEGHGNH